MATTTPYFGWSVPTSTDYVKDGASAIETLGDSIDTSMKSAMNSQDFLHVQDRKSTGTNAGTFTSGAWRTRDLNTVLTNTISGASLSSNTITLPAGEYFIWASAPAYKVDFHSVLIQTISPAGAFLYGTSEVSGNGNDTTSRSQVIAVVTYAATQTIQLQHRANTTVANWGFGRAAGFGIGEVYSDVKIWKVG